MVNNGLFLITRICYLCNSIQKQLSDHFGYIGNCTGIMLLDLPRGATLQCSARSDHFAVTPLQ